VSRILRPARVLAALGGLVLLPATLSAAQDPAAVVVDSELAFARSVRSLGVRDGFLQWLAPTGIVFRPGPVIGVGVYEKQPPGWRGLLAWRPAHAAISADGKLGWSTGPWTWQRDSTAEKPEAHGTYLSVWRLQADGSWKVALDCGVSHPAPTAPETTVTYAAPVAGERLGSRPLAARQSLYQADANFAKLAGSESVPSALARYAAEDVVVSREGLPRQMSRDAALRALAGRETGARLVSTAQFIADSGDLGYTYGTFVSGPKAAPDSAWYVHVWHRGPAASWRLASQVVMPLPPKQD